MKILVLRKYYNYFIRFISLLLLLFFTSTIFAKSNLVINVYGLTGDALENAKDTLILLQKHYGENISPQESYEVFKQAAARVKKAIEPYGLFRARVQASLVYQGNVPTLNVFVIPGPVMHIRDIHISVSGPGENNPAILDFINHFPIKPGDPLNISTYNNAKTKLFIIAKNQGYLRAFYKNQLLIDLHRYESRIQMHLETGPIYYFGRVHFETHPYSENFMRRFIRIKPGEVYSSDRLLKLQQDMENSYYFRSAVINPDFTNIENYHVPLRAYLYPPKAERYSLGLGYGTLTGPRITGIISLRRIGDEGHHFEAEAKASSVLSAITGTYYIPGEDPLTEQWMMGVNLKRFLPKAGKSDSATLSGGYSKKGDHYQSNISLNMLFERFKLRHVPGQTSHMLYPSWMISYLDTDKINSPTWGRYLSFTLKGSAKEVLSTTSFVQALGRAKFLFSPFSFSRIVVRGDLGYTSVHNLKVFPLSLRFFAGGINSIRGFADMSIGPGKYLEVASIEYQHKIVNKWYAAVFYDVGTATNHFNDRMNRGVGVGVLYNSLVGPIKVYMAQAISKRSKPYSLEFSLGPEFA